MKAGAKDPRPMARNAAPFSTSYQPDQYQTLSDQRREAGNFIPLTDAAAQSAESPSNQSRIQCEYVPFPFVGSLAKGVPQLIIPRNGQRSNLYIINLSLVTVYMSFGTVQQALLGIPIAANDFFSEKNGVIGINDIYITAPADVASAFVLGYEGVPIIGTQT